MRAEAQTAAGLVLSPTPVTVTEGGNGSYTVALAEQPSDTVTVTIRGVGASGRSGNRAWLPPHFNLDTTSLMFTTSDWSTPQTVTFSIGEDNDIATNWSVRVEHTAAGGGYDSVTADQQVWIRDNDAPVQGTATITPFTAEVLEGEPAIFVVHLDPAPTSRLEVQISVVLAGNHFRSLTTGLNSTIFAGQSSVALRVTTVDDNVREADGSVRGRLEQRTLDGYIIGSPGSATVVVKDNDGGGPVLPAVSISGGAAVTEGGTARFTVTATPPPTGDLTVSLFVGGRGDFVAPDDQGRKEVTVGTSGSATYTVDTVDDDADEANGLVRVLLGSGEDYRVGTPSAAGVVVNDDDDPGTVAVVLTPSSGLAVSEGSDATYTVRLASQPTAEVAVAVTGTAGTDLTLDAASLTFTTSTWDTAQAVTVSAAQDDDAANDAATLLHTASGGNYGSVTGSLGVTVTDDDTAGLTLSTTMLGVTEGDDAEYTVRLATQPTATVTVAVTGTASTDLSLDSTSLTFTTSTWSTAQTVTVSAAEDIDAANDAATLLHTASGGDYAGETAEVAVTVTDDDTAGLTLSTATLGVAEGGDAEYTVRLATQPTATVTVAVTGTASTDLTLSAASLTFTTSTWNTAQTVTVSAAEDIDAANDAATLLHTASGGDYAGETAEVAVTVTDDDTPGTVVLSPTSLGVAEGADAEYTVRLSSRPTAEVTVAVTGQAGTDLTLDAASLTFTTSTWNTVQTVTVSAAEDDDAVNDAATLLHTASGANYGSVTGSLGVTVTDDDTAALTLSTATLGVAEGGDAEYTVRLATQPTAEVTVAVTGQASTDLTLSAASLTFTTSTWSTAQTVTVSAAEDIDAANDAATLLHTASGGDYAGETAEVAVTVTDDDTPGTVVLSPTSLGVAEGADAEYTVRLSSRPTAEVTVAVTGQAGTDLTLDAASLTFTTSTRRRCCTRRRGGTTAR